MRPPRIIIIAAFSLTALFITFISVRSQPLPQTVSTATPEAPNSRLRAFFSLRAPFSLFPPNAIITLTNDNTTAFLARPAAFGPLLPARGLKGPLWIGSGFGDDSLRQAGVAATAEGELGCSDVPGWVDSYLKTGGSTSDSKKPADTTSDSTSSSSKDTKESTGEDVSFANTKTSKESSKAQVAGKPSVGDGTDDYLHHPLHHSTVSKSSDKLRSDQKADHADIQSIQEGAEIAGKVVLFSRGGCGFLEKVKWAQRRGAVALIVGDDVKGGPLIQMYARGDTTNVTIPAIFTSRTTAHLLSSLMGPDAFTEGLVDESGKSTLIAQRKEKNKKTNKKNTSQQSTAPKTKKAARGAQKSSTKTSSTSAEEEAASITTQKPGWFRSWFLGAKVSNSRRPPSSGQLDWATVDDWKEDEDASKKISKPAEKAGGDKKQPKASSRKGTAHEDDFVIGVQDWRDPDLVGSSGSTEMGKDSKSATTKADEKVESNNANNGASQLSSTGKKISGSTQQDQSGRVPGLRGGSIIPGSGEYEVKSGGSDKTPTKDAQKESEAAQGQSKGLLTVIFGGGEEDIEDEYSSTGNGAADEEALAESRNEGPDEFEGLWVTLTPTSGASPFLDTLLVLVVSPLVTLTVVYALLLIRSRIRRRRWRAPKSVVERLPVRTYQTISTPGNRSPRLPSPTSSSPTTPLLQRGHIPRPRSRTTTGVPESTDMRSVSSPLQVPGLSSHSQEPEKTSGNSGEWRKFMGRQVECVVCLEEYVDGVSRVMSLPCGHEFHVDCITPWLTTRRRTCPICKGDVVRSLARGSPSSPRYESYHDDSDDDDDDRDDDDDDHPQVEEDTGNFSTSLSTNPNSEDVEQGMRSPSPTRPGRGATGSSGSWRNYLPGSLASLSRSPKLSQPDRSR